MHFPFSITFTQRPQHITTTSTDHHHLITPPFLLNPSPHLFSHLITPTSSAYFNCNHFCSTHHLTSSLISSLPFFLLNPSPHHFCSTHHPTSFFNSSPYLFCSLHHSHFFCSPQLSLFVLNSAITASAQHHVFFLLNS